MFGFSAGYQLTTQSSNVGLGAYTLGALTGGNNNLALGYQALQNSTTSFGTVAIGMRAGRNAGSYGVYIGYNAGMNETGQNKLYIANSDTSTPLIYGEFDNNFVKINDTIYVENILKYGTSGVTIEGVNIKDNVTKLGDGGTTDYLEVDSDGTITLHGDARYDDYVQIPVGAVSAPGESAATFVSRGLNGAWEYSDNQVEHTSVTLALPSNMDRTVAPTLRIGWETPTTSAVCKWKLEYIYRKEDEDMTSTTATTVYLDATSSTTANGLTQADFTLTAPDSDDGVIVMRLTRLGNDSGDTCGAAVYTHGGRLMYKANKL